MSNLILQMEQLVARQADIDRLRAIVKNAAHVLTKAGVPTTVRFGKAATPPGAASRARAGGPPAPKGGQRKRPTRRVRQKKDGSYEVYTDYGGDTVDDLDPSIRDESDGDDGGDESGAEFDHNQPGFVDPTMLDAAQSLGIR